MVPTLCQKGRNRQCSIARSHCPRGKGQIDADLGGGVIKQRLPRPGQGRSASYRTIVLFHLRDRAFFIYGFSKSDRANIITAELRQFKQAAHYVLALSDGQLAEQLHRGNFTEVTADE